MLGAMAILLSNLASCGHPSFCISGPSKFKAQLRIDPTAPSTGAVALYRVRSVQSHAKTQHIPWHSSQRRLVQETSSVVAIGESFGVENATGQILKIDASEAIGSACVASETKDTRVGGVADYEVGDYFGQVVLRGRRATVPVERDAFLTRAVRLSNRLAKPHRCVFTRAEDLERSNEGDILQNH